MADDQKSGFTGTTSIVAIAAVIGWMGAVYFYTQQREMAQEVQAVTEQRAALQEDFNAQRAASGTLDDLNASIESLTPQVEEITAQRDAVLGELDGLTAQRDEVQGRLEELETQRTDRQAEVDALEAEAQPLREELAGYEERRTDLENQVAEQTRALEEVGARLEEARAREAEVQETLSNLSKDVATLTGEASQAETELQTALQDRAQAGEEAAQLREEVIGLEEEQRSLSDEIARLTGREAALSDDVASIQAQRTELQTALRELTEDVNARTEDLVQIERQIEERISQQDAGESEGQEGSGGQETETFQAGEYTSDDLTVTVAETGDIGVSGPDQEWLGEYRAGEGILWLQAAGDESRTIECEVSATEGGFDVAADQENCEPLAGRSFAAPQN